MQDDFGGTIHDYQPNTEEIVFAEKAFAAYSETPIYGRVDIVWDNDDKMAVSELELVDPEMWFRNYPPSADLLAEEIFKVASFKL